MFFAPTQIAAMAAECNTMSKRCQDLVQAFVRRTYAEKQAREYAVHGFACRLDTLVNASKWSSKACRPSGIGCPPARNGSKRRSESRGLFVFNAFGSINNLAWVFAIEKAIKNRKGDPLHRNSIGLAACNIAIRKNLSQNFQNYLKGKDEWFKQLEDFRHSLAHRMPPFVPPCITTPDKEAAYNEIQVAMDDAIARRDFDTYDEKSEQQCALGIFVR